MSDNLESVEVTIDNEQPLDDVVSTNEELESTPQDTSTDEFEVVIEDEDDQETTSKMSQSQLTLHFVKRRKLSRIKQKHLRLNRQKRNSYVKSLKS